MTEDMLWEQAAVLAKLGTSEEAARVRAKMQSTSLLSDMQAFKVQNVHVLIQQHYSSCFSYGTMSCIYTLH